VIRRHRSVATVIAAVFALTGFGSAPASVAAQSVPRTEPATPRFEVASVRLNSSDGAPTARFPLGPGDAYVKGTTFSATNQPLIAYIRFAFGRSQGEQLRVPAWVNDQRFDIVARATGDPTKNDMRLMVRALLAERFKMAWHIEQREQPVLELVVARPGRVGPQLLPHRVDQPCESGAAADDRFAAIPCGSAGLVASNRPDRASIAGRAEPMSRLAALLSNNAFAGIDRVVLDRTGLHGTFDFIVEWGAPRPEASLPSAGDDAGPALGTALREQLGLVLKPAKASVDAPVIDHIEQPAAD